MSVSLRHEAMATRNSTRYLLRGGEHRGHVHDRYWQTEPTNRLDLMWPNRGHELFSDMADLNWRNRHLWPIANNSDRWLHSPLQRRRLVPDSNRRQSHS